MTIIHPLLASRSAPNYRQSWRLAGVWRRAINLMTESGELLTLHRQGSGFGPGGWVLRRAQFDALCGGLCGNERPQVVAQGIRLGRFTVKQHSVIVCCVLRRLHILNRLQLHGCNARRKPDFSDHWRWRQAIR